MAISAGVRELKNRLTHYLRLVRQGERIIVTHHDRPVAVLKPIEDEGQAVSVEERLLYLATRGEVRLGEPKHRLGRWKPVAAKGTRASRIIASDRDSR
jgi:prevent-host-death family protein